MKVSEYFDRLYGDGDRYWWREDARYKTDPVAHPTSLLTQMTLRAIAGRAPGRALDIGAGEGADSIRLALLGYAVEAVEISKIGAAKIRRFAAEAGIADRIRVETADITTYIPEGFFDVILCNGVLQYVEDKKTVIGLMQDTTVADGINVISLWSTYTEVPDCHKTVDIFCDDEDGVVYGLYQDWTVEVLYFDRDKTESSHAGMPCHSHSHIKLIARRPRLGCAGQLAIRMKAQAINDGRATPS